MADAATSPFAISRRRSVRLGIWIELVTIGWLLVEATVALLVGFGGGVGLGRRHPSSR